MVKHALVAECAISTSLGGDDFMSDNATSKNYVVPPVIGTPLVALIIDDEIRLVDPVNDADLDDIRASQEASRQPGERISIEALRRRLGI